MLTKQDFIEQIKKFKKDSKNKIILVEGKKDKAALAALGIKNIITLKKPLYQIIEQIVKSNKECILLLDLDKKGKQLYARISSKLKQFGVKIDNSFREFLFKTKLRQIEGISKYLEKQSIL